MFNGCAWPAFDILNANAKFVCRFHVAVKAWLVLTSVLVADFEKTGIVRKFLS